MKSKIILTCVFGMLFVACKKEKTLNDFMIGNWQTEYMKIEMPTVNKTDSTSVMEEDFSTPNSARAQSTYKKDGTFTAWFKKANGNIVGETGGSWKTKGDSLYVNYPYLGKEIKAWYVITQKENAFDGKVIYDWDNDGEFDDTLFMKSKRIILE